MFVQPARERQHGILEKRHVPIPHHWWRHREAAHPHRHSDDTPVQSRRMSQVRREDEMTSSIVTSWMSRCRSGPCNTYGCRSLVFLLHLLQTEHVFSYQGGRCFQLPALLGFSMDAMPLSDRAIGRAFTGRGFDSPLVMWTGNLILSFVIMLLIELKKAFRAFVALRTSKLTSSCFSCSRTVARKFWIGGLDILKFDKNSTVVRCFIFQFGGACLEGLSPPKPPRGDGTEM